MPPKRWRMMGSTATVGCVKTCASQIYFNNFITIGIQQNSWLAHYAISQKIASYIPYDFNEHFNCPNPRSCTMVLSFTRPLKEVSTRNLSGVKGDRHKSLTVSLSLVSQMSREMREPQCLTTKWVIKTCYRESFTFLLSYNYGNLS
jgi:hypothetical protein